MTSEEIYENIDEVKCPYCGNPVNWKHFSHWIGKQACFIAECWSGSTHREEPRHIFQIWVMVKKETFVAQKVKESQK